MDNASYHNLFDEEDNIPNKKNEIREWLTKSGVEFSSSVFRPELLQLTKAHKKTAQFHIDKYLESIGHVYLRSPRTTLNTKPKLNLYGQRLSD